VQLQEGKNTVFFVARSKEKIPSALYNPRMFFVKPVFVDKQGLEYWEVASYDKKILAAFYKNLMRAHLEHIEMLQFRSTKLDNIYFPTISPDLTEKQKRAFELAIEEGYYAMPKTTDLATLARIMKVSLATYQEHLRRAESKIMPRMQL
jgi:predicted DNA binding protein